jgi:hypothetical protein
MPMVRKPVIILALLALRNPFRSALAFSAIRTASNIGGFGRKYGRSLHMSSTESLFVDAVSAAASQSLGRTVELVSTRGGGYAGGGGASTSALLDKATDTKYFLKSAYGELDMLRAEYEGVKAMSETNTIQVPTPIAFGQHVKDGGSNNNNNGQAFVLFEYLEFCGGGNQYELGVQLAKVSFLLNRMNSS